MCIDVLFGYDGVCLLCFYPLFELLLGVEFADVKILSGDGVDDEFQLFLFAAVLGVVNTAMALLAGAVAAVAARFLGLLYAHHHPLALKLQFLTENCPRKVADYPLLNR